MTVQDVILLYVCPSMGALMANLMFAAPINDLREALIKGSLGSLNPLPWAMQTGNCLGWLIYGYYTHDPFIIASNLPGFIVSIWLNLGASKLQYLDKKDTEKSRPLLDPAERSPEEGENDHPLHRRRGLVTRGDDDEASNNALLLGGAVADHESVVMVPQERMFLRILVAWACILIYTSWLYPTHSNPANLVGFIVNLNLIFYFAAPLKTMKVVISERDSASIHRGIMYMNWINCTFWVGYGIARKDPVIFVPNGLGLLLGIAQGVLCFFYPAQASGELMPEMNDAPPENAENPEEVVPRSTSRGDYKAQAPPLPEVV